MKTLLLLLSILLALGSSIEAQSLLNQPESVVYDSTHHRYLVSNKATGQIVAIDTLGVHSYFVSGLGSCRGLTIVSDVVYVACNLGLRGYNLASATLVLSVTPSGMSFLNDVEADTSGYLYVTDSNNGQVYKVTIATQTSTTLVAGGLTGGPNGLLYDKQNRRLLVCCWGTNAGIYSIDPDSGASTLLVGTGLGNLDGLAEDNEGNIYVSSWNSNSVYRFTKTFATPAVLVSGGHSGPADIFFNRLDNTLAVPNFNANTVELVDMDDDDDLILDLDDNCPGIANPDQADCDDNGVGNACDTYCCGDANGDWAVDISDAVFLISFIFSGGATPDPLAAADANCDETVDISDAVYLISYIFSGGTRPCAACR